MAHCADLSFNESHLVDLSWQNQERVRRACSWAPNNLGLDAPTEQLVQGTVNCFNHWHEEVEIPGGYGGCVTPALVKKFLQRLGKDAMAQQATHFIEQARALPVPQAFPVTVEMIDGMGKTELRNLAKLWGVTQNKATNAELKTRLKEHLKSARN